MNRRHRNIPIFIPHMGCPHQCVFCNQRSISGQSSFSEKEIPAQIDRTLRTLSPDAQAELAYFGGSFTGIDRGLMIRLLELAAGYVAKGLVSGIRLSTRPDMIDEEVLSILRRYPVKTVELGLQSMNDRVLAASHRGHTAAAAAHACEAVLSAGFDLVGQMMLGLPESTLDDELQTADFICRSGASAARIYPTVVFYHTPLADMTAKGLYQPLTQEAAILRGASVLERFQKAGLLCLRIGLCATEELSSPAAVMAGPNHPALGELIQNEAYFRKLRAQAKDLGLCGQAVELLVSSREVSRAVGQHRCNITRLLRECGSEIKRIRCTEQPNVLLLQPYQARMYKSNLSEGEV